MSDAHETLARGRVLQAGGKLYQKCGICGQVVRINKLLVGSMHFCLTAEEIAAQRPQRQNFQFQIPARDL